MVQLPLEHKNFSINRGQFVFGGGFMELYVFVLGEKKAIYVLQGVCLSPLCSES